MPPATKASKKTGKKATAKTKTAKPAAKTPKPAPKAVKKSAGKAGAKAAGKTAKKSLGKAAGPGAPALFTAASVAGLMTPDPLTIRRDAPVADAVSLLHDKGISAALVVDDAGKPVGSISRADLVRYGAKMARLDGEPDLSDFGEEPSPGTAGAKVGGGEWTVGDVMTPLTISIAPDAAPAEAAAKMVQRRVHRLWVVEPDGKAVGVVSAMDLLAHLNLPR